MKKQPTFLLWLQCAILLLSFSSLQAQWQYIGSPENGHPLHYAYSTDRMYMVSKAGLFYSENDGNTWNNIPLPDSIIFFNKIYEQNGSLYLLNSNENWYPDVYSTAYRSDDNGQSWKSIYPPTFDPITGWELMPAIKGDTVVFVQTSVAASSVDKGENYAQYNNFVSQPHSIFFHQDKLMSASYNTLSSSPDLGMTWDLLYTSPDSFIFFTAASVGGKLYKFEEYWNAPDLEAYFYRSDDNGVTWEQTTTFSDAFTSTPTIIGDADNLFLYETYGDKAYHSTDGGTNWQSVDQDLNFVSYQYLKGILAGIERLESGGGVWLSHNDGQSFESFNSGFTGADCEDIISGSDNLWVNANTKVFENENGNQWDELQYFRNIATGDGTHFMAYASNILKRSIDGGQLWYTVPSTLFNRPNYDVFGKIHACGNLFFISVFHEYWYSLDFGLTWQLVDFLNGEDLSAYAYDDPTYVIAGERGTVFQSTDGLNWQNITYDIWAPGVGSIQMLHRHGDYTFARVGIGNVKLDAGSTTWESYVINTPDPSIFSLPAEINAMAHFENVLVGTIHGHGVYISLDNGVSWQPFNFGLHDFQTRDIEIVDDKIYVAVNGGVWTRPVTDMNLFHFSGIVFNDENENGIQDITETGIENIIVRKHIENNSITTLADGSFGLYSQINQQDTISAVLPSAYSYITTSPVYVSQPDSNLAIGIHFVPNIYDAAIYITNNTPFRPGFASTITLTYKNNGTAPTDLEIKLALPDELEYLSSSPEATFIEDTLTWLIQDVPAFASGNITIDVKTDVSVPLGTPIILYAFTDVTNDGDANQQDNEAYLIVEVVGSYDPNDKAVFPSGYISPAMIADTQRLEYTIRFQNTGNFPASFVRIQDTLSSHLDITSLEILSASHPYTWKLLPQNVLDVFFDDINLPDSSNDERGSHGFVKFAINAKPTLQLADHIENKAFIYFDFNVPVITNTVGSTVGIETGIKEPGKKLFLTASPSPAKDFIMVTIRESITDGAVILSLYDAKGAFVKTKTSTTPENIRMDVQDLPSGVYYLHARVGRDQGTISILKN